MHISANKLKVAAEIAEKIESLQKQVAELLQNLPDSPAERGTRLPSSETPPSDSSAPERRKRDGKGRGTLRPAVHQVLAKSKAPLNAGAIHDALVASKYKFEFAEPRRILRIRLYKMAGIQPLGGGLFRLKKRP